MLLTLIGDIMSAVRKKKVKATSPAGELKWFKFVTPDKKFDKYTCDLIVEDTPELQKLVAKMEEVIEEELQAAIEKAEPNKKKKIVKSQDLPIDVLLDAQGNETGKYLLKFRMKASGVNKEKQVYHLAPPALFNAQAKPITGDAKTRLKVFNGSIGKIAFEMSPYALATGTVGVTLRPTACMILKIQQADADASQFGFSASELANENEESEFESENSFEAEEGSENADF